MDRPNLRDPCYKTKDDKRHSTVWGTHSIEKETPEERDERLKNLREGRGTWVYDEVKRCMVRKENYISKENDMPQISRWRDEFAVVATGQRMSKRQLRAYCKSRGKIWENE